MNFKSPASVKYDDYKGTAAADRSSALIDNYPCDFFANHPTDDEGRPILTDGWCLRAIRAYFHEDRPTKISVQIRMEEGLTRKFRDYSVTVPLKEFFSLFKRFNLVLKQKINRTENN